MKQAEDGLAHPFPVASKCDLVCGSVQEVEYERSRVLDVDLGKTAGSNPLGQEPGDHELPIDA